MLVDDHINFWHCVRNAPEPAEGMWKGKGTVMDYYHTIVENNELIKQDNI